MDIGEENKCLFSEFLRVTSPCIANMENAKKLPEVLSESESRIVNLNETGKLTAKCELDVSPQSGVISGSMVSKILKYRYLFVVKVEIGRKVRASFGVIN